MRAHGYMVDVELTDDALTAAGTTRAARVALRGSEHDAGPLVIPRDSITSVEWKGASALVNGRVTVHHAGGTAVLHFRRKQQAELEGVAQALGAAVV